MHMDKECPFSSVTDYGRVWMKSLDEASLGVFWHYYLSGGQTHMDKECPFSSVPDYGRVWMKGARQQALECV